MAAIIVSHVLVPSAIRAQMYAEWCTGPGTSHNCFFTLEQCRAAVSGVGGVCNRHPSHVVKHSHKTKIHDEIYKDSLKRIPDSQEEFDPWRNAR